MFNICKFEEYLGNFRNSISQNKKFDICEISLKSDSYPSEKVVLFASLKAL